MTTDIDHIVEEAQANLATVSEGRPLREPLLLRVADVEPERVEWLWGDRLPVGKLVTVDGDPGLGKTTTMLDVAARVTTGTPFPDGFVPPTGAFLMLTAEDGIGDTIRPRLEAAGADLSRCHVLDAVLTDDGPPRPWLLPGDVDILRTAIERTGATLVVIDPLMAFLHGSVNSWRDQDVRGALHPLKVLAEETGCTIVLIRHLTKSGGPNALYRGGGSIGIVGAARAGLLVARDPDDDSGRRCIVAVPKANLGPTPPSLAYHIESDEVLECGRIVWDGESEHTATSLLAEPASEDERSKRTDIEEVLRNELADGRRSHEEVVKAVRSAGITFSDRTFRRACERLGVQRERDGFGPGSVVYLSIPDIVASVDRAAQYRSGLSTMEDPGQYGADQDHFESDSDAAPHSGHPGELDQYGQNGGCRCPGCGAVTAAVFGADSVCRTCFEAQS